MKPISSFTLLLFLCLGISCFSVKGLAQSYRPERGVYAFFPSHPLMDKQIYIREKADQVVYNYYNSVGEKIIGEYYEYAIIRKFGNSIDAVNFMSGLITVCIYTYSIDDKILIEQFGTSLPLYNYYSYDSKGRVESIYRFYDSNLKDTSEIVYYTYLDSQIIQTDSGYIHSIYQESKNWLHIKQKNSDSIIFKMDTTTTEYVFNQQKQLIRAGDERYTYLEDGGIVLTTINNQKKRKHESFYDSNGLLKRSNNYTSNNDKWELEKYTLVTHYKDGAPLSNGSIIEPESIQIYETRGGVVITSETQQSVRIYSITGQLVKQLQPISNEYIPLPRGLYIVKIKNQVQKVYVK